MYVLYFYDLFHVLLLYLWIHGLYAGVCVRARTHACMYVCTLA